MTQDPGAGPPGSQPGGYDPNQGYQQPGGYPPNPGYQQPGGYDPNQAYQQPTGYDPNQTQGYQQGYGQQPGYPGYNQQYAYPAPRGMNTMAILAIVFAFVFPILGIVFGIMARNQIKESGEEGAGLALAGIIIGAIFTAITLLFIIFFFIAAAAVTSAVPTG